MSAREKTVLWLFALAGPAHPSCYREIRYRTAKGMKQEYLPVAETDRAADRILQLATETDVFVGVAPRTRKAGTAEAVAFACALWADLDTPEALVAVESFPHPPSMLISSGTGHHAYWITDAPYSPEKIVRGNRRLAHHLGADMNCTDAARIMRPPGTFNHKGDKPKPVTLERVLVETYDPNALVGNLPDPTKPAAARPAPTATSDDALLRINPPEYVKALTGHEVGTDGKIVCPFHPDRTPSLHVYPHAEQGWACFGCGKGGTIYDFAANLWGLSTRGDDFKELRRRIARELLKVSA